MRHTRQQHAAIETQQHQPPRQPSSGATRGRDQRGLPRAPFDPTPVRGRYKGHDPD
eukprot:gene2814-3424_t